MTIIAACEGMSGAGKTTTVNALVPLLVASGYRPLIINEKQEEPFRSWIIRWHSRPASSKVFSHKDVEAVAACRAEIHRHLRRHLSEYDLLIFDRSVFTSVVYQMSSIVPPALVWSLNIRHPLLLPQHVFLFRGDPAVCHQRIVDRLQQPTQYRLPATTESVEHIEEVGRRYELIRSLMEPLTELDVLQTPAEKAQVIYSSIHALARSRTEVK